MVGFSRRGERVAVECEHPEFVTVERQVEIGIGADIFGVSSSEPGSSRSFRARVRRLAEASFG